MGENLRRNSLFEFAKSFEKECGEMPEKYEDFVFPQQLIKIQEFLGGIDLKSSEMQKLDTKTAWVKYNNFLKPAYQNLEEQTKKYQSQLAVNTMHLVRGDIGEIDKYITLLLIYGLRSAQKEIVKAKLKQVPKEAKEELVNVVKEAQAASKAEEAPKESAAQKEAKTPQKEQPKQAETTAAATTTKQEKTAEEKQEKPKLTPQKQETTKPATTTTSAQAGPSLLDEKKKESEQLQKQIEEIQKQIEESTKAKKEQAQTEQTSIMESAELNAQLFKLETSVNAKKQKLQKLKQDKEHTEKLKQEKEQILQKIQKLEKDIENINSPEVTIERLNKKLQDLRLDPHNDEVTKLEEKRKKYANFIKKLDNKNKEFEKKIKGQQSITSLQERLDFVKKLEETNIWRKRRAELALSLSLKAMRCDSFQKEMRSVV